MKIICVSTRKPFLLLASLLIITLTAENSFGQKLLDQHEEIIAGPDENKVLGTGYDDDRSIALDRAFEDAINNAIGVIVSSAIVVENDALIKDEIISLSRGFIKEYKIIDEKIENSKHKITIIAVVIEKQIYQTLKAKGVEVRYDASAMFANMQAYEKEAAKELAFVSGYVQHMKLMEPVSLFDYDLTIGDPAYHSGYYYINITINPTLNNNYNAIQKTLEDLFKELAYESKYYKKNNVRQLSEEEGFFLGETKDNETQVPESATVRTLSNIEINRLKKSGTIYLSSKKKYLDLFTNEFSPYVIVIDKFQGYLFLKYLNKKSVELLRDLASYLIKKSTPVVKVHFTDGVKWYGMYKYNGNQNWLRYKCYLDWISDDPEDPGNNPHALKYANSSYSSRDVLNFSPFYESIQDYDGRWQNNIGLWQSMGFSRGYYDIIFDGPVFWKIPFGTFTLQDTKFNVNEYGLKMIERFEVVHFDELDPEEKKLMNKYH